MANKKLNEWQTRGLRAIDVATKSPDFQTDAAYLKQNGYINIGSYNIVEFMEKYKLPMGTLDCIVQYIETGEIEPTLIKSSIVIVSDKLQIAELGLGESEERKRLAYNNLLSNKDYVKLLIPPDTTQAELIDFVKTYDSTIKKNLMAIRPSKRIRSKPKEQRNQDILAWHLEGLSNQEILARVEEEYADDNLAVTMVDIRLVLSRMKSR